MARLLAEPLTATRSDYVSRKDMGQEQERMTAKRLGYQCRGSAHTSIADQSEGSRLMPTCLMPHRARRMVTVKVQQLARQQPGRV